MSIRAIGDRVVTKSVKVETKTSSGLLLAPSSVEINPYILEVVGVGNGEKVGNEIKIGDRIIHSGYGLIKVKDKDEEFIILDFENIIGIID